MANEKYQIAKIEINVAVLNSIIQQLTDWSESYPIQLQAAIEVIDQLNNDIMFSFRKDTGHARSTVIDWVKGDSLPDSNMTAVYLRLLIQKVQEEIDVQLEKKSELIKLIEPKPDAQNKIPLPSEKLIIGFSSPTGVTRRTSLDELEGYKQLPNRLTNALLNSGIHTVDDIGGIKGYTCWQARFLDIGNIASHSVETLYQFLLDRGFEPKFADYG